MTETKEISTAALVSLTTGCLFCSFSEMHAAAEHLMGHPIWTHHFADKELWGEMKKTAIAQHPNLPVESPKGVNKDNYREYLAQFEAEHGKTLPIRKGSGLTAMLPTDDIPDHLKNKTIIVSA